MGTMPDFSPAGPKTPGDLDRFWLAQDCLLCDAESGTELLCHACREALPRPAEPCPRCAMPSLDKAVCGACLAHPPHFDATVAPWRYDYPVDRLVLALKFQRRLALAPVLARALEQLWHAGADVIVPMPLHRKRLAERGFNQSVEIARSLARSVGVPLALDILVRSRHTAPQSELPHAERRVNVRGAFSCCREIDGLSVALVDDVMTTGATLDEAARTLKHAGAARVENWVAARTLT